jgi:hypothetical protein
MIPIVAWQGFIAHVESTRAYQHPPYQYAHADYALYNVSYIRNMTLRDPNAPERGRVTAGDLLRRVGANVMRVPSHLGGAVSAKEIDWVQAMLEIKTLPVLSRIVPWRLVPVGLLSLGAIVVAGFWILAADGEIVLVAAAATYFLHLCLLPSVFQWPRYLAGLAPPIVVAFLVGIRQLNRWLPFAAVATLVGFCFALEAHALAWYFLNDFRLVEHQHWSGHDVRYRLFSYDRAFVAFDDGLEWLEEQPRDGVVVSSMAPWVYVRTGMRAVMPPLERQPAVAEALLESVPARYVIVDRCGFSFTREYTLPLLRDPRFPWREAFATSDGGLAIYERSR